LSRDLIDEGWLMTLQTLTLGKQQFVVVPENEFHRLKRQAEEASAQDRGDVAEAKRRKDRGPIKSYSELRKKT
jgi:hypothetical protein